MDDGSTGLETVEAGAEFEVYLKTAGSYENARDTERDHLITDEHGYAGTKQLPYGIYTVRQAKGTEGFELAAPFDVFIDKDGCSYQYLLNNAPFTGYLKIQKTDAESGLSIPYAGAAFQIYNPDGTRVTMQYTYPELTVIDTFYTNEEGYLITPEVLPFGKGYSIVEVKAPYGYVLNSDPVYFDVTADSATEDGGITLIEVTRSNMPQKGIIRITKTGEVFWTVTEADGIYKPVYAVKSLPGAVFEVRAAEDIYTLDGVMHYAKGEVVDTITTGADGVALSKELYLGKYEIQEITAPHGMVLNGTIQTVELTYAGQEVAITETAGNLYNERQKVKVSLSKVLEQSEAALAAARQELARQSEQLSQLEQSCASLKAEVERLGPAASAYEEIKDRTAGIELDAHRRAQTIVREAEGRAEKLRAGMEQWMEKMEQGYDLLRTDMDATISHAANELSRVQRSLEGAGTDFADYDQRLAELIKTYREERD